MQLRKVTVKGYRSIAETLELHIDPRVTVILGANDHGKSNLLAAILHLNPDHAFDADRDLNWDFSESGDSLPCVEFFLGLSDEERTELRELELRSRQQRNLLTFLDATRVAYQEVEDSIMELRGEIDSLRRQLDPDEDEVDDQNSDQDETSADEGVNSTDIEEPDDGADNGKTPTGASDASQQLTQLELALTEKSTQRSLLERHIDLVHARLLEVGGEVGGVRGSTLQAALDAADEGVASAEESVKKAEATLTEASEALESEKETAAAPALTKLQIEVAGAQASLDASKGDLIRKRGLKASIERAVAAAELRDLGDEEWQLPLSEVRRLSMGDIPTAIVVSRTGVEGELAIIAGELEAGEFDDFFLARLPKVGLIRPLDEIPDSVGEAALEGEEAAFMRGIFHYAGLFPEEWSWIFEQNDQTTRRLDDASHVLNETLRQSWRQGTSLTFLLRHNSAEQLIELRIEDPAVKRAVVRASRRSSGFTHFFALKTILHAHQKEAGAKSYIWLFDEPGVHLHPDGQHDLVQVVETLARANQVIYSTHSVFMANKNYPARHRLILKDERGSVIEAKPFRSRWRPAIDALGMSLPGTFMFATHVLLVEGDSDSILINSVLQRLIQDGKFERDVNSLAVMGVGDTADAAALLRILTEGAVSPRIAALFDGDEGGRQLRDALTKMNRSDVQIRLLGEGMTTEDYVIGAVDLYPAALVEYLHKMETDRQGPEKARAKVDIEAAIADRIGALEQAREGTKGIASWSRKAGREVGNLDDKPSPVGVAREYSLLLQSADLSTLRAAQLKRARDLANWIGATLELPLRTIDQEIILEGIEESIP
jgi:predicted ATPase